MFFVGTSSVGGHIQWDWIGLHDTLSQHPSLDFVSTHIRQHATIDFHAWGQFLSAFLDHLDSLIHVVPNIPVFKIQIVLGHDRTDPTTPPTVGFQVGNNF
jgi:hypothetical protein